MKKNFLVKIIEQILTIRTIDSSIYKQQLFTLER